MLSFWAFLSDNTFWATISTISFLLGFTAASIRQKSFKEMTGMTNSDLSEKLILIPWYSMAGVVLFTVLVGASICDSVCLWWEGNEGPADFSEEDIQALLESAGVEPSTQTN